MPVTIARANGEPRSPGGGRGELEEPGVRVYQELDPFADEEATPVTVSLRVSLATARAGQGDGFLEGGQGLEHDGAIRLEGLAGSVDRCRDGWQGGVSMSVAGRNRFGLV